MNHCKNCSMPKSFCRAEAMSNSEKIKPIALAVIELYFFEGFSQWAGCLVRPSDRTEGTFGLGHT